MNDKKGSKVMNLKIIMITLEEWEEEAKEETSGQEDIRSMSEASQLLNEHIQKHHGQEIKDIICKLTIRQGELGADHDDLTPEDKIAEDQNEYDDIEEVLDLLRAYTK